MTTNVDEIPTVYQQVSARDHVLTRPEMYVGSTNLEFRGMLIYDETTNKIVNKCIGFVPAFYKLFDELLVNMRDNAIRHSKCDLLKIDIDQKEGKLTFWNNGSGIRIETHREKWKPEVIFGTLMTHVNYDSSEKRTGSRNGFGAKCANIFSTKFIIELTDGSKKYTQVFENNMEIVNAPDIEDISDIQENYLKITYYPDFKKMSMPNGMSNDIVALLKKRVYDIAMNLSELSSNSTVLLNDKEIVNNTFENYVQMHYEKQVSLVYDSVFKDDHTNWMFGVVINAATPAYRISYVNGICTYNGGTHVTNMLNQIIRKTIKHLEKTYFVFLTQDSLLEINNFLNIHIDCAINDPDFRSQVNDKLVTSMDKIIDKYVISDEFMGRLFKETDIIDKVLSVINYIAL